MRPISAAVRDAIRNNAASVVLASFDLPAGIELYWSGIGPLLFDGETWSGVGGIAGISGVSSEASTYIQTITFTLAVSEGNKLALSQSIRGREAIVWMAFLDMQGQIIPDPIEIVRAQLDTAAVKIEQGQQQISLIGQTAFYTLETPSRKLWTNEQQQFDFPGDTGFDRMPSNQAKEITWSPP